MIGDLKQLNVLHAHKEYASDVGKSYLNDMYLVFFVYGYYTIPNLQRSTLPRGRSHVVSTLNNGI